MVVICGWGLYCTLVQKIDLAPFSARRWLKVAQEGQVLEHYSRINRLLCTGCNPIYPCVLEGFYDSTTDYVPSLGTGDNQRQRMAVQQSTQGQTQRQTQYSNAMLREYLKTRQLGK